MDETTTSTTASDTPAPRPTARRPRPASLRRSPVDVHAYAPWALVAAVIILALAVLGVISVPGQRSESWQAVFLSNGQAYFGHITRATPNWLTLRNVYYLQTTANVQPGTPGQPSFPDLALMKLGKELHGPEDVMRINRQHVLFIEELRDDSPVVQTIEAAPTSTPPPTPATGGSPEAAAGTSDGNVAPPSE
ncbi:hypothetical protein HY635_04360 [Candidatus Uhrbacteria bacterium]|nr:hypothetical protein [Candidatus Uhrbacteria bacterium]